MKWFKRAWWLGVGVVEFGGGGGGGWGSGHLRYNYLIEHAYFDKMPFSINDPENWTTSVA